MFNAQVRATLGVNIDFVELNFPDERVTLQLYDTAGQEQYKSMTRQVGRTRLGDRWVTVFQDQPLHYCRHFYWDGFYGDVSESNAD